MTSSASSTPDRRGDAWSVGEGGGPRDGGSVNAGRLLLLYTGGTIGMTEDEDGRLVPLDLSRLVSHLPIINRLPVSVTLTAFADPIDSAAIQPQHWLDIADAIVEHAPGHTGVVVLHGTDTMAYTAAALSFLLEGLDIPIVLTGAQRPITAIRSDGRENLVTAAAIALAQFEGAAAVPEVTIFFDDVLLRGNCSSKVHADSYRGSPPPTWVRWRWPESASSTTGVRYGPQASPRCGAPAGCAPTSPLSDSTPPSTKRI